VPHSCVGEVRIWIKGHDRGTAWKEKGRDGTLTRWEDREPGRVTGWQVNAVKLCLGFQEVWTGAARYPGQSRQFFQGGRMTD